MTHPKNKFISKIALFFLLIFLAVPAFASHISVYFGPGFGGPGYYHHYHRWYGPGYGYYGPGYYGYYHQPMYWVPGHWVYRPMFGDQIWVPPHWSAW